MKKLIYNVVVFILVISGTNALYATNYILTTNGDWNVASNWSPVGVPGVGDNVFVEDGQTVSISSGSIYVNNLTIVGGILNQTGGELICSGTFTLKHGPTYTPAIANLISATNQFNHLVMIADSKINSTMPNITFSDAVINGNRPDGVSFKAFLSGISNVIITNDLTIMRGVIDVTGNITVGGNMYAYGGNVGGDINKSMTVSGVTNILDGLSVKFITFLPNGGVIWTGTSGSINVGEAGTFKIPEGTTMADNTMPSAPSFQINISNSNGGGYFELQGIYTKIYTGKTFINFSIGSAILSGEMNINAGSIVLGQNTTIADNINVAVGAFLETNGGPVTQTGGLINCQGTLLTSGGGTTTLNNYNLNIVSCQGGTLTLTMPTTTINTLNMNSSASNVVLNGPTNFIFINNVSCVAPSGNSGGGGTISNTGDILFSQNLTLAHGAINNTGTVTVNGDFFWYGGGLGTTVTSVMTVIGMTTAGSTPSILFPMSRILKKTLILQGGGIWTAFNINIGDNGFLKIPLGQMFAAAVTSSMSLECSTCTTTSGIEVLGAFTKSGSNTLTFIAPLINSGNFSCNAGDVYLSGSGGHFLNGQVVFATGSKLRVSSPSATKNSGSLDCPLLMMEGGELILNTGTTNTIGTCNIQGGKLTLNNPNETIGTLTCQNNGGILQGSTNLLVSGNAILTGVNAKLANTGTITVNGNFTWNGGIIGPEISAAGTMTVNGLANLDLSGGNAKNYRTLILNGGGSWTQGGINLYNDGSIQVSVGATFTNTLTNNNGINCFSCSALSKFEVMGTALKTGSNETTFSVPLINSGTFTVNSGIINLSAASTLNGTINFAAGTELKISNGISTQSSGTLSCPRVRTTFGELILNSNANTLGECLIQGGRLTINNATQTISSLSITASSIRGIADITVTGDVTLNGGGIANTGAMIINGNFTWNQGQMGETGVTAEEITANGITTIAITTTTNGIYRSVVLNGNANWTQGNMYLGLNGILRTAPTCTFTENSASDRAMGQINGASIGTFQNQGVFNTINGGNLTATGIHFLNSGTLNIQTGTMSLGNSGIIVSNTGIIKGIGTISVNTGSTYTNTGTFAPGQSPGTLNHTGIAYTNSTLDFEIQASGNTVSKDLLQVTGNMTLGGTLNIQYLSGNIPLGTYDIATCTGTRTGTFATINYPANCTGNCNVVYTSNKAQLVLTAAFPVELLNFSLVPEEKHIRLYWQTATEENSSNFEIERSTDGHKWHIINTIIANNQPKVKQTYEYSDSDIADWANSGQTIYYRLKMNDLDGKTSYSPIKNTRWNTRQNIQIWPNPAKSQVQLTCTSPSELEQNIRVLNMTGQVCHTEQQFFQKGINTFSLDIADLVSGVYFVQIGAEQVLFVKE